MREIKFRAWFEEKDGEEYCHREMVYFGFKEGKREAGFYLHNDREDLLKIAPIMQFTGLKDKNNKEIYEGDIIQEGVKGDDLWNGKATTDDAPIGEVIWDNNGLWNVKPLKEGLFHHQDENNKHRLYLSRYDGIFVGDWSKNCEVVGNIYENPELLEGNEIMKDYDDDTGELIAKIADKDAEIKRLEARCKELVDFYIKVHKLEYIAGIVKPYEQKIKRLEAEVERLKCCGNCKHFGIDDQHSLYCENDFYPFSITEKCDKWEGKG